MKRDNHIREAERIGNESFSLLHFEQLPRNASKKQQIEALEADQRWQEDHHNETSRAIDALIQSIDSNPRLEGVNADLWRM